MISDIRLRWYKARLKKFLHMKLKDLKEVGKGK